MKILYSITVLILLGIINFNCSVKQLPPNSDNLEVTGYSPVYPVLIGKKYNPVHRINIHLKSGENKKVQDIIIDLQATNDLKDISNASIFYTGKEKSFSNETLVAFTSEIKETLTLPLNLALENGDNYFWLMVTLTSDANMDQKISGIINQVIIDDSEITLQPDKTSTYKNVGYALRKHNDDGVDTYRIPGLATTNHGTLVAVYDIRKNSSADLQEDIDVGMSRSTDGGKSWEPMKVIMDMGEWGEKSHDENGIGDPSILVDKNTNTIWVAALWLHGSPGKRAWWASQPGIRPEETGQFILVKSEDDGLTWSEPINITAQIKDSDWYLLLDGPGKGITMDDGTLVFPAQFKDKNQVPHSTIVYSKDQGETWKIGTGAKSETTEAQVVELEDGSLMLNMRDNRGSGSEGRNGTGARSVAITRDLGKTWTEHSTSRKDLPEPVCMASLIRHSYRGKNILIFSNPADQYVRENMTIKISEDEGMSWPEKFHLLIDEGRGRGYSCLTSIDENTIGILYEGSQADLVFQRIALSELYPE